MLNTKVHLFILLSFWQQQIFCSEKISQVHPKTNFEECSICLEDLKKDTLTFSCGHRFHRSCILHSIAHYKKNFPRNEYQCPLCRAKIELKKPKKKRSASCFSCFSLCSDQDNIEEDSVEITFQEKNIVFSPDTFLYQYDLSRACSISLRESLLAHEH